MQNTSMLPTSARICLAVGGLALAISIAPSVPTLIKSANSALQCWKSGNGFHRLCPGGAAGKGNDPRDRLILQAEAYIRPRLPLKDQNGVALVSVSDIDHHMLLAYEVPRPLAAQFESSGSETDRLHWMREQSCSQKSFASLIAAGVEIHMSYSSGGKEFASVLVGRRECAGENWSLKP